MTALVLRGDAARLPLPDDSVDLICTSPPYWSLRSYQDGGAHYSGQLGSEESPQEFIDALLDCTKEWARVLKPSGSMFVNLGDKYNAYNGGRGDGTIQKNGVRQVAPRGNGLDVKGVRAKCLLLLPERYRIGCVDRLGLIARSVIIWDKPNGLPESVTDRVRRSHEDWVHLTLAPRYYSAIDEIREPHLRPMTADQMRRNTTGGSSFIHSGSLGVARNSAPAVENEAGWTGSNPLGKLPGSVWTVATEPLNVPDHLGVDHFAAFPTEWPRRIISGWSPAGICTVCGEGRRPVSESRKLTSRPGYDVRDQRMPGRHASGNQGREGRAGDYEVTLTGYACGCPTPDAPTRPSVVLDPFGGTGTTALCASVLGRIGITVDLSHDYSRLAQWRTQDPAQRAKAMRVEKPPIQIDGQYDMFGGAA